MRTAVSLPPQTQPVSRPSRSGAVDQAERRPVAERDRHAGGAPAGRVEPRREARRRGVGAVLGRELERAVGGDEADARQRVEREAQALVAGERVAPARAARCRTSRPGTRAAARSRSARSSSAASCERRARGPTAARRRRAASASRARCTAMRRVAHPVEPGLAVGRVEDVVERVAAVARPHAGGDGEQVPVVVAEHAVSRRRRGRAAGAASPSDAGPRLTRSPST